jgi:hypothetical protein
MSPRCIRLVFALMSCSGTQLLAQSTDLKSDSPFLKHLRVQKLYTERQFVLVHAKSDRVQQRQIEMAWNYSAMGNYDSALFWYGKTDFDSIQHYNFGQHYFSVLFITNRLEQLSKLIEKLPSDTTSRLMKQSLAMMNLKSLHEVPGPLQNAYYDYARMQRKSLFLAGLSSTVIPGSGKFYYGQKRQGWNVFFANVALGAQTYEWYRKAGVKSPGFYIFGGLFSVFYISNIYGTVKGLKKARRDRNRQLHHEIVNHYFSNNSYPGQY